MKLSLAIDIAGMGLCLGLADLLTLLGLWEYILGETPKMGWPLYWMVTAIVGAGGGTYCLWAFFREKNGRWKHKWGFW